MKLLGLILMVCTVSFADTVEYSQNLPTGNPAGGEQYVDSAVAFASAEYNVFAPAGYMFSILGGLTPSGPSSQPGHSAVLRGYRHRPDIDGDLFTQIYTAGGNTGTTPSLFCGATHVTAAPSQTSGSFQPRPILLVFTNPCGTAYTTPRILVSQIYGAESITPDPEPFQSVNVIFGGDSFQNISDSALHRIDSRSGVVYVVSPTAGTLSSVEYLNNGIAISFRATGLTNARVVDITPPEANSTDEKLGVVSDNKLSIFSVDESNGNLTLDSTLTNVTNSCVLGINGLSMTRNPNVVFISSLHPVNGGAIHRLTRTAAGQPWTCGASYINSSWTTPSRVPVLSDDSPNPDKNLIIGVSGATNMLMLVEWANGGYSVRSTFLNGPINNPKKATFGASRLLLPNNINGSAATGMSVYKLFQEFRDGFED